LGLKEAAGEACLISIAMPFHSLGAMIEKALSLYVAVLDLGVESIDWSQERRSRAGE